MRALRGIGIVMVFVVAATLFAYLAFVHPIGTQFVRGKVTKVVTEAKKMVKETIQPGPIKPEKAPRDAQPTAMPAVAKTSTNPTSPVPIHTEPDKNGSKTAQPAPLKKVTSVAKTKPRSSTLDNPFKLERSEFSRADIDAIIEKRRRIKDKLGEL